jgi:hypothetical protein
VNRFSPKVESDSCFGSISGERLAHPRNRGLMRCWRSVNRATECQDKDFEMRSPQFGFLTSRDDKSFR